MSARGKGDVAYWHMRAANSFGCAPSPRLGERVGVRGLPAVLFDANPLTHSFVLQKSVLSPLGRGRNNEHRVRAAEMLGELQALRLVVRADALAVERVGRASIFS